MAIAIRELCYTGPSPAGQYAVLEQQQPQQIGNKLP